MLLPFSQLIIVVFLVYYFFLLGHRFTFYRERYLVKIPPIRMDNSSYVHHSNIDSIGKQIEEPIQLIDGRGACPERSEFSGAAEVQLEWKRWIKWTFLS